MKLATSSEMRSIDARAIGEYSIVSLDLMESAGGGIATVIENEFAPIASKAVTIVCGKGNNGGDGLVVARHLHGKGAKVSVFLLGKRAELKGDPSANLERWESLECAVTELPDETSKGWAELDNALEKSDIAVDALLGTGAAGTLTGKVARATALLQNAPCPVVAVDVPTGVNADTGAAGEPCVRADLTATLALMKRGLCLYPGVERAGQVYLVDIGIPDECVQRQGIETELVESVQAASLLPKRPFNAHKGFCGKVAIVGGSPGLTGAVALAGLGALRSGSGLVTAYVPAGLNPILETKLTEVMTSPLPETSEGSISKKALPRILDLVRSSDALLLGPGLSRNAESAELSRAFAQEYKKIPSPKAPVVLDADGINAFEGKLEILKDTGWVITPHPGEMGRLTGESIEAIEAKRIEAARVLAMDAGVTLVLKGAPTVTSDSTGGCVVNSSGNPGMATGGSGDVLSGMVVSFLGQGMAGPEASVLAVYLHGLSGDLAAEEKTQWGLSAGDLVEYLPQSLLALSRGTIED
jgi:NAD(P)H-hydrate epimerase